MRVDASWDAVLDATQDRKCLDSQGGGWRAYAFRLPPASTPIIKQPMPSDLYVMYVCVYVCMYVVCMYVYVYVYVYVYICLCGVPRAARRAHFACN